jgi:hypothetical protein
MTTLHLSEAQKQYLTGLASQLEPGQRDIFWNAVYSRLGGKPADETVGRVASLIFSEIRRNEILARRA